MLKRCITPLINHAYHYPYSDVPELLSRKKSKPKQAKNVRIFGRSIDERPDIVKLHLEIGHWEIDTIVGKRKGKEAVVLTLVEKVTHKFIAIKIRRKDVASVKAALRSLKIYYGSQFATVFKTITADNGTEFAELSQLERYGIMVYFAHPYSSYERAIWMSVTIAFSESTYLKESLSKTTLLSRFSGLQRI